MDVHALNNTIGRDDNQSSSQLIDKSLKKDSTPIWNGSGFMYPNPKTNVDCLDHILQSGVRRGLEVTREHGNCSLNLGLTSSFFKRAN